MSGIPQVQIIRHGSGWLIQCRPSGRAPHWEQWTQRRPAADQLAHEHQKNCKTTTKEN